MAGRPRGAMQTENAGTAAMIGGRAGCDYVRSPPGEIVTGLRRGDLVLIRGPGWLGKAIRLGAWRRFRDDYKRYGYWSHAALVVNDKGHLLEVHARGVALCSIEKYRDTDFCHVRLDLSEAARDEATRYAQQHVGQHYDLWGFVLLGISVTFGDLFRVPDTGKPGCVSLIARALQRAGITFDRAPPELMPADLAKRFGVLA
ncbi:MAG TPA: hypothetical protein VGM57_06995 [Pseudolabrys sp.]